MFEPVQVLLFAWTKGNVVNPWLVNVVKLTNWFAEFADVAQVGNVLKVFEPVQVLLNDGLTNDWAFRVVK